MCTIDVPLCLPYHNVFLAKMYLAYIQEQGQKGHYLMTDWHASTNRKASIIRE